MHRQAQLCQVSTTLELYSYQFYGSQHKHINATFDMAMSPLTLEGHTLSLTSFKLSPQCGQASYKTVKFVKY